MFLESSQDILYLVLAFCIVWVTVFLCWMFYYLMRILKNTSQIVEEFRERLRLLTETINHIRGKVEYLSNTMTLVTGGLTGLVKKMVGKKAASLINDGADSLNEAAKEAVDKAVEATAEKLHRASKRIRKEE